MEAMLAPAESPITNIRREASASLAMTVIAAVHSSTAWGKGCSGARL